MDDYSLHKLGSMIGEPSRHRVNAYIRALRAVIKPDSVVLEIGAGIGFFSLVAAKLGARHVYAVETNPLIALGRELAAVNNVNDQVSFYQAMSTDVTLPERANVVVSDIRGALPWFAHHIASIVDARERLLTPDAVQIPTRDTLMAALVNAPRLYATRLDGFGDNAFKLDLSPAARRAVNAWSKTRFKPKQLVTEALQWFELDYRTVTNTDAEATLNWTIEKASTAHGIAVWFDSVLTGKIRMSNAPGRPYMPMYGQSFFSWAHPVDLTVGDRVQVRLTARWVQKSGDYVWRWRTHIVSADGFNKADFWQSTFSLQQLDASRLVASAVDAP